MIELSPLKKRIVAAASSLFFKREGKGGKLKGRERKRMVKKSQDKRTGKTKYSYRTESIAFSVAYLVAQAIGKGSREVSIVRNIWNIFR